MPIDFPSSPSVGQRYTYSGVTYVYTSQAVWAPVSQTTPTIGGPIQVGFRAFKNGTNQTGMANTTWTKVTFPVEEYDFGNFYDPTTSRWTPPAGLVHLDAKWSVSAGFATDSNQNIAIYKNGVELKRNTTMTSSSAPTNSPSISLDDIASGSDYYEVFAFSQGIATSGTIDGTGYATTFNGHVVGGPQGPAGVPGAVSGAPTAPQGRMTLQAGTPVMTATVAGAVNVYYVPYAGSLVPIYDGTSFVMTSIGSGLAVATTDNSKSPSVIGVSKCNDWFIWNDAGTIRLGHGPDWTSDTARSAGTALTMINGIWVNNNAITNGPAASRGTYVGTTRSNATSTLDWIFGGSNVAGVFGIWNCYNRVNVSTIVNDSAATWTYAGATPRPANNNTNNRVGFVMGLNEDVAAAIYVATFAGGATNDGHCGIGLDSTNVFSGIFSYVYNVTAPVTGQYSAVLLGYHFFQALEANPTGTGTWYAMSGTPYFLGRQGLQVRLRM